MKSAPSRRLPERFAPYRYVPEHLAFCRSALTRTASLRMVFERLPRLRVMPTSLMGLVSCSVSSQKELRRLAADTLGSKSRFSRLWF